MLAMRDGRWAVSKLSDQSLLVEELDVSGVPRSAHLTHALYASRAATMEDLVILAIDQSVPKSVVVQEVAIALMSGMRLEVPKDEDLGVGLLAYQRINEVTAEVEYVCTQSTTGKPLYAPEQYDVTDLRGAFPVVREHSRDDRTAFGAALTFVDFVGRARARDAIQKARAT